MKSSGFRCLVVMGLLALISPSHAQVYRCVDSSGATTYTQSPCAPNETAEIALVETSSDYRNNNCNVVRSFAWHVADAARRNVDSSSVFKRYGGLHQLPAATVTIVNNVYNSTNMGRSRDQAASYAVRQCKTGNLGKVNCAALPKWWMNKLGGCKSAAQFKRVNWFGKQTVAKATRAASTTNQPRRQTVSSTVLAIKERDTCRARIQKEIDRVHSRMRQVNRPAEQDRLQARRRKLGDAYNRC